MSTLDTSGRALTGWNPEKPENRFAKIVWTTLAITTFSLVFDFIVWLLSSAVTPRFNDIGFHLTKDQICWITSVPGLSCVALRLIYMFLPTTIGARKMIGQSSLLYILPMLGWFLAVQDHNTSFGVLPALSLACGIGAVTFSGYMPSTGFYLLKRLAGTTLGLQGDLGNMGMSVIQLTVPFLMSISLFGLTWVAPHHEGASMVVNATIFSLPWSLVAAFLTFRYIKGVPLKANIKEQTNIFGNLDTWFMTVLYIMTLGVFSGFAAQTASITNNNYGATSDLAEYFAKGDLPQGVSYAFIGTLIGSLLRFAWEPLHDYFDGTIWTFIFAIGMAVTMVQCGHLVSVMDDPADSTIFMMALLTTFLFVGVGNASTFKQTPVIMSKRQAGGAIGFTAAVASFGPFLVGITLTPMPMHVFFYSYAVLCVAYVVTCWIRYAKPGAKCSG